MNNNMTLPDLLNKLRGYNPEEVGIVKRAYEYADTLYKWQMRQSGEPYISYLINDKFKNYTCNPKKYSSKFIYNSLWNRW